MRRTLALATLLAAACHGAPPAAPPPVPEAPDPPVRGSDAAAAALPPADRDAVYAQVVRFYRPSGGQARWLDPRPLASTRGAATDSAVAADDEWALAVREGAGSARVCVVDGEDGPCRGRTGGILRLSRAYADAGGSEARVFVVYTPVRDVDGTFAPGAGPVMEMLFTFARDGGRWRMVDHRAVRAP